MRKIIAIILVVMLIISVAIPTYATENSTTIYEDYPFYGRLYIPDVDIDVALYYSLAQEVSDREDSANIYKWKNYRGEVIGDHASQSFSGLFNVQVGTKGYIKTENSETIRIKCVKIFNGYNGLDGLTKDIVDEYGNTAHGLSDYLMYTCRDSEGEKVRILLWDKYEEKPFVPIIKTCPTFKMPGITVPDIPVSVVYENAKTAIQSNIVNNWLRAQNWK